MDNQIVISIADDFSATPGPRLETEGSFSGEDFRQDHLIPKFQEALDSGKKLVVNLDGVIGYGTSFLEEAFGGLARRFGSDTVLANIDFISEEEPYLKDDVLEYISKANI